MKCPRRGDHAGGLFVSKGSQRCRDAEMQRTQWSWRSRRSGRLVAGWKRLNGKCVGFDTPAVRKRGCESGEEVPAQGEETEGHDGERPGSIVGLFGRPRGE